VIEPLDEEDRPSWVSKAEEEIRLLADVRGVRIVAKDGEVAEVHVRAVPGRSPHKIVRDVVSLFQVEFQRSVDFRKVSIVTQKPDTVDQSPTAPPPLATAVSVPLATDAGVGLPRVCLKHVAVHLEGGRARVDVELNHEGSVFQGSATGTVRKGVVPAMGAQAMLLAVRQCIDHDVEFELEDVLSVPSAFGHVVLVTVRLIESRIQHELVGAALDRGELHQATAAAVLDAVNRVLGTLPLRDHVEYAVD
jgi:hypothetical protein